MTWCNPRPDQFVGARSYGRHVNRTDRLYALVEELRACAPRRRSARVSGNRLDMDGDLVVYVAACAAPEQSFCSRAARGTFSG